ncbi:Cytochrome c oxidase copper chaperone - like 1 [Theobroma cacao]|nr:Cytochrome c oxidase copper chaperone - like 1 [Theobroma cacao]
MSIPGFFIICMLHSIVALTSGALMIFYTKEVSVFGHGHEIASKLQGSTPHDQLLIQTSESFSGLLLFTIGFVLFMVAFVKDTEFQSFFARGCVLLHVSMAIWRVSFEGKLEDLAHEWPRQALGDMALALSWLFLLAYSWREKIWNMRRMGGLPVQNTSALALPGSQQNQVSAVTSGPESKPKKKICCACPETKKLRDECIVEHGEEACAKWIEAHRKCLRAEGFNV